MNQTLETAERPPVDLALRESVTPHGTDICVSCGKDTGIPTDKNIHLRTGYIEGCGQLCEVCAVVFG